MIWNDVVYQTIDSKWWISSYWYKIMYIKLLIRNDVYQTIDSNDVYQAIDSKWCRLNYWFEMMYQTIDLKWCISSYWLEMMYTKLFIQNDVYQAIDSKWCRLNYWLNINFAIDCFCGWLEYACKRSLWCTTSSRVASTVAGSLVMVISGLHFFTLLIMKTI